MHPCRRRGATLGLVAVVGLAVLFLGLCFFFLIALVGGSREMTSAVDSGALNLAKQALKDPSKKLSSFSNADIANNFSLLADNGNANLLSYNRFVAQAIIVAINAKEENTPDSLANARKIWRAVNDVGEFLRTSHQDANTMGSHFVSMASSNNLKMLGKNGVGLRDYDVGFLRRNGSTNVYLDPQLLNELGNAAVPVNSSGIKSANGYSYLAGYTPFSLSMPSGDALVFIGVPVFPQRTPHLVTDKEFKENQDDSFVGNYPSNTLPPNAFRVIGKPSDNKTQQVSSAACAIVGIPNSAMPGEDSAGNGHSMSIPGGYIVIRNGPSAPRPAKLPANKLDDIFAAELARGLVCQGSKPTDLMCPNWNISLWNEWVKYNTQGGPMPDLATSVSRFQKGDKTPVTLQDLKTLTVEAKELPNIQGAHFCIWEYYDDPPVDQVCVDALNNFKNAYNRPGTIDPGNVADSGFTALEQFKLEVLGARSEIVTCATVPAPANPSGVKWFDHKKWYASPEDNPYNFGEVKTPYDYLEMIDECAYPEKTEYRWDDSDPYAMGPIEVKVPNPDRGKIRNAVLDQLLQRCKEIDTSVTKADLEAALKSLNLPLGADLYLYVKNKKLIMTATKPSWAVAGTQADGKAKDFGEPYDGERYVGAINDGEFWQPFAAEPQSTCVDKASWTPSTGFNNLLGELRFSNSCSGGGKYCQPN